MSKITLNINTSPHVVKGLSTDMIMKQVIYALLPAAAFGVYTFGTGALLVLLTSTAAAIGIEHYLCKWSPDILNFAKQVTNGVQPLGGVVVRQNIHDTFMAAGGPDYMLEFPHGYTYSAHPVTCAAGIAGLALLESDHALQRVRALAPGFESAVHGLKGVRHVADVRNFGLAAGITVEPAPGEPARRPYQVAMAMYEKGFYVRYGGDTIQLAPPFISTELEIDPWSARSPRPSSRPPDPAEWPAPCPAPAPETPDERASDPPDRRPTRCRWHPPAGLVRPGAAGCWA